MVAANRVWYPSGALKKGIVAPPLSQLPAPAAWDATALQAALTDLQPAWWYDYLLDPEGATYPNFCPMFTARSQITGTNIAAAVATAMGSQGHGWIMFYNEPDGVITYQDAATDWNTIVAHADVISSGVKLLSPALSGGSPAVASYMQPWLALLNRQPDAIAVHSYGNSITDPQAAVASMNSVINTYQTAFPTAELWQTEFAHSVVGQTPTDAFNRQWVNSACQWHERRAATTHYAFWTLGPQTRTQEATFPHNFMYDDSGTITALGQEYRDNCGKRPTVLFV